MMAVILYLLLFLSFASPVVAAITEVGGGTQSIGCSSNIEVASLDCIFPGSVSAGNLLIVAGTAAKLGGVTISSITDTVGTSYTILQQAFGIYQVWLAYGLAGGTGANTVTVDGNVDAWFSYAIDEFAGVAGTPLDVDGGYTSSADAVPTKQITTLTDNALLVGVLHSSQAGSMTPGTGYTEIAEEEDGVTFVQYNTEFKIATTAGAYNVNWTLDDVYSWEVYVASFKAYVASGGSGGRRKLNSQTIAIE